jgi:copper(I)-binding protein
MIKFRFPVLWLGLAVVLAACGSGSQDVEVSDFWARPGLAGGNSAVYFIVKNDSRVEDRLLSASSEVAQAVELHKSSMVEGVMQMEMQAQVPLPAGVTEFKPGGLHVMLIGLNQDLNPGDSIEIQLDFAEAPDLSLQVPVRQP